jgi:hypothetical protein
LENIEGEDENVITYSKIDFLFDTNCIDCTESDENNESADPQGLQDYITNYALSDQEQNLSATYLAYSNNEVVGYFTVAITSLAFDKSPDEKPKTRDEITKYPALLIANFCTNKKLRKIKGIGSKMLKHCIGMGALLSQMVGCRYVMLYATTAEEFYSIKNKTPYKFFVARESKDKNKPKLMLYRLHNKIERHIEFQGGSVSEEFTASLSDPAKRDQNQQNHTPSL